MMTRCLTLLATILSLLSPLLGRPAEAQNSIQQLTAAVIQQLQTGRVNPQWYAPAVLQVVGQQTGNTGYYPQLAQLGPVTNIQVTAQTQLPQGIVYTMVVTHQAGASAWSIGTSNQTRRIEYLTFQAFSSGAAPRPNPQPGHPPQQPQPQPQPVPTAPTGTGGTGQPTGGTGSVSEACQKFPNLC